MISKEAAYFEVWTYSIEGEVSAIIPLYYRIMTQDTVTEWKVGQSGWVWSHNWLSENAKWPVHQFKSPKEHYNRTGSNKDSCLPTRNLQKRWGKSSSINALGARETINEFDDYSITKFIIKKQSVLFKNARLIWITILLLQQKIIEYPYDGKCK